jgi:hypothetical protein
MRRLFILSLAAFFPLVACNDIKKPDDANFTRAINQYLAKHGHACVFIGQTFLIDVPVFEQKDQYGIAQEMAALEQAGLVHASHTTAVVHGMLDGLRGPTPPQPVKRYDLTDEGKKYFRQTPGIFEKNGEFCYGEKVVDSIVKWTEPMTTGPPSQSEVTYTYKLVNLAVWAEQPGKQRAFPDIRTTIGGASKTDQIAGLQLTNKGWEVPEQ